MGIKVRNRTILACGEILHSGRWPKCRLLMKYSAFLGLK